ncbi:MAG: GNAT family N-acetyltransferase [Kurthia gibsonii]|uniref:GNAT family N-acetyltransferase n=1 Tax=Kurthia gibsonii TaxID=33946 RepID=A0ABU9LHX0_9BACL|nr:MULTISPECIES: GNAT family N-acetyltransferase [Kurthia]MCA9724816.1 GNAT family N-acetyltransferase [Kurthia sp.]AMA64201.1 acetyltransferase family protein [Kurthia sp. 11kri321]MEB6111604.1 GNAT family N-acetyltransferase [Kurthia gibsonii]MEB7771886.1 GNAT family N-acetyltransferase [Kurthia gibsonii]RXH52920.1 N-acetyltransferase [Kurthia gibsonii]
MLNRYKKTYEKIAMGLLSFMPDEKDLKVLQQTIQKYDTEQDWELYLYKLDADYIGLIGVERFDTELIVRHISVDPSHRGEGIGTTMVQELAEQNPTCRVSACQLTKPFIEKCLHTKEEADIHV